MNIWSRLGISVALAAVFCIAASELLQSTLFYERHKWAICIALIVFGPVLLGLGLWLNRRIKARYLESQAQLPEQDRDTEPQWEPFLLLNPAYWGVMVAVFGCILIFLVPTYTKRAKAAVVARAPQPAPRKPAAKLPPPITNAVATVKTNTPVQVPRFKLQGITIRGADCSALIDGRTYFAGDFVRDAKVISIASNAVLLEWRGISVPLRLH